MKSINLQHIINKMGFKHPSVGVVLGSGLSDLASELENKKIIKYDSIPSFPVPTIDGHPGEFVFGKIRRTNINVVFANGRFHYYEGLPYKDVHLIVDIFSELGCKYIITTNSSGCLEQLWNPGDIMIINSHIDATYRKTISTPITKEGNKYYNKNLISIAKNTMKELGMKIRLGKYAWTLGPTYETASEIELLKTLQVKAVGMSTVPEIERAHKLNLKVLSLACLTNYAVGITKNPLSHTEVIEQANKTSIIFRKLILEILKKLN